MTGASGVGKTTIARTVRRLHPEVMVFLDEELERPTEEFMASIGSTEGPGGSFQRGFALYSIPQIAHIRTSQQPVLLDCQCRIAFLEEAISTHEIGNVRIILIECDDITRDTRLYGRGSPELAHEQMRNWSRYLHGEAMQAGIEVLDTGALALDESVARIVNYLQN